MYTGDKDNKNTPTNIYQGYLDKRDSLAAQLAEMDKKAEDDKKRREDYLTQIKTAQQNHTSLKNAMVEKAKPKYDDQKEKRLRTAAIISSLGDLLTAATKGFIAYGKNGAGVVPQGVQSKAMEGIQQINDMQQKYLRERKEWESLNDKWELEKSASNIEAAKALLSAADAESTKRQAERKDVAKKIESIDDALLKYGTDAAIAEQKRKQGIEDYETKKRIDLKYRVPTKGGTPSGGKPSSPDYTLGQLYSRLHPNMVNEEELKWSQMTKMEQEARQRKAENDPATLSYFRLLQEGLSDGAARGYLEEVKKMIGPDGDYDSTMESLLWDYEMYSSDMSFEEYINYRLNSFSM